MPFFFRLNVSVTVKASTLKFVSPSATTASWTAGTRRNLTFTHTLGAGADYSLEVSSLSTIHFQNTFSSTLWTMIRMPGQAGAIAMSIVPKGQPQLNVTRVLQIVAPQCEM